MQDLKTFLERAYPELASQPKVKTIVLPSGANAEIIVGNGGHMSRAQVMSGGVPEKVVPALFCLLVKINGIGMTMEDVDIIPMHDYLSLTAEIMGAGK